jgi:hypothetical protein
MPYCGLHGSRVRPPEQASAERTLTLRYASADRPLDVDRRIPTAHLGWQVEFMTCTVGDTTQERFEPGWRQVGAGDSRRSRLRCSLMS